MSRGEAYRKQSLSIGFLMKWCQMRWAQKYWVKKRENAISGISYRMHEKPSEKPSCEPLDSGVVGVAHPRQKSITRPTNVSTTSDSGSDSTVWQVPWGSTFKDTQKSGKKATPQTSCSR